MSKTGEAYIKKLNEDEAFDNAVGRLIVAVELAREFRVVNFKSSQEYAQNEVERDREALKFLVMRDVALHGKKE